MCLPHVGNPGREGAVHGAPVLRVAIQVGILYRKTGSPWIPRKRIHFEESTSLQNGFVSIKHPSLPPKPKPKSTMELSKDKDSSKAYYEANKGKWKAYYEAHREEIIAKERERRTKKTEEGKEKDRQRAKRNREKKEFEGVDWEGVDIEAAVADVVKKWKNREYARRWREKHPDAKKEEYQKRKAKKAAAAT